MQDCQKVPKELSLSAFCLSAYLSLFCKKNLEDINQDCCPGLLLLQLVCSILEPWAEVTVKELQKCHAAVHF